MCGDWNTSIERSTCQTRFMKAFLDRNGLRLSWHHPRADKANTYVNHNLDHESYIDHFVVSSNVYGNIRMNNVVETPLNPATHCPVMLVFGTSYSATYVEPSASLYCTNVLCECDKHRSDIDNVCKQLIDVLIRAGKETRPQCSRKDRGIPYWNDEEDDARETALFWHWLWGENGKPRHGNVAAIMRKTRASYHYAVRHIKRRECEARKSKMAESVSMNNQRDLWVETKKVVAGKKPSINIVDGACNPKAFSEVFASKYETRFHGKPTEPTELQSLHTTIRNGIVADDESYSTISLNDVVDALKHIKLGKNDGNHGLTSDHQWPVTHRTTKEISDVGTPPTS